MTEATARANPILAWIDRNILELGREMRWSYLPPLMVYVAAGIQGLTGIVGTFFVKSYLGLSPEFLVALGFWAMIPWSIKMVLGHIVDLIWRWKAGLIFLGAGLIAASVLIMAGLIGARAAMVAVLSAETWFVIAALLAPIGYVLQDAVADAMTVEAVPRVDDAGRPYSAEESRLMHTTMQTLGRVAIIGGSVLVALVNVLVFDGTESLPPEQKVILYRNIYLGALVIPLVSVAGVVVAGALARAQRKRLMAAGHSADAARAMLAAHEEKVEPNWWILLGGAAFVAFTLAMGLSKFTYNQEIIFAGSLGIVVFMMTRLVRELAPEARATLIGTAVVIFLFRAVPGTGPGVTWWMIDELKFDEQFLSVLGLIGSALTLAGMFLFRRFIGERSITYIVGFLTLTGFFLSLPILGMAYGVHEWTARMTGGVVDARFIALIDTALESPLGQIAMIPMLAWIANSAPEKLKATYFAVMASFTNLALSGSQLLTKYVNKLYVLKREMRDPVTHAITTAADYSQLQPLLISVLLLGLVLPFGAILIARAMKLKSA